MKRIIAVVLISMFIYACGGDNKSKENVTNTETTGEKIPTPGGDTPDYDPNRGIGKFTDVKVGEKLDLKLAGAGEKIYSVKCAGCHKLTDEKLVGPGWKGVSQRHRPEWIMNFIT